MQQQYIISSSCKATPTKFMLLISFISLIFLSVLIEAAPVRAVLTEVNNLRSFANYAAAAYCKVPLENWDCNVCKANDKTEVVRIIRNEELHTKGFIAMDHLRKIIVIAFRGTVHYKNLVTDLKVIKTDYDPVPDAKVHRGFYEAFRKVQPQVTDEVLRLSREYPDFDIGFIGHSLGGALAALAALDLIQKEPSLGGHNEKLFLKTFGQPRIGDEAFAEYVDNNVRVLRSIVRGDPVPRLPPSGEYPVIGNYRHFGEELYIDRPKDDSNAFVQCGVEDPACSASIPLKKLKVRVHSGPYYDVKMSDCKDGGSDDDDDDDLDDIDDDEFNEEAFGDDDGGDDDDGDDDDGDDDDDDD